MQRIVVVEDDPAILRGLSDNLRRERYDVVAAADGEAGYRLIMEAPPDLILLDLMLPGLSGYELCRRVRYAGLTTPIVMLSARSEEADRVLGLESGADDYVSKPFSLRELLARIRAILRQRQDWRAERTTIDHELRDAAEVQRQLLPRVWPALAAIDCSGCCMPARQVGGDYIDWLELEPGILALLVADVAGKGVPAALLVAALHGTFRTHAPLAGERISELVTKLNDLLCQTPDLCRFATLLYAIVDSRRQRLAYVNAGHPPGIVWRGGGHVVRLAEAACPVGLFRSTTYRATELHLQPGDWIVLYTDGVTEAVDERDDEFGEARLVQTIGDNSGGGAEAMCHALLGAARSHAGGRAAADDLTVLAARVR